MGCFWPVASTKMNLIETLVNTCGEPIKAWYKPIVVCMFSSILLSAVWVRFSSCTRTRFQLTFKTRKFEGDVQRTMLEQHSCYVQAILGIFNCQHRPLWNIWSCSFTCLFSYLTNTTPFTIQLLALGKNDALLQEGLILCLNKKKKIQTFHGRSDSQIG